MNIEDNSTGFKMMKYFLAFSVLLSSLLFPYLFNAFNFGVARLPRSNRWRLLYENKIN